MKKLYQLKKWLTLENTARHLSIVLGESVSEADVLQLCLDGHLKLSVYFVNGAVARRGKVVSLEQAKMYIMPRDIRNTPIEEVIPFYLNTVTATDELPEEIKKGLENQTLCYHIKGFCIGNNEVLEIEESIIPIDNSEGVYDLAMIGAERLEIEHKYQMLTGGAGVTTVPLDGAFVVSPDGQFCQLQEHFDDNPYCNSDEKIRTRAKKPLYDPDNYYPGSLPDDSVLVVRTSELAEFESRISESESEIEKPLSTSKCNTLRSVDNSGRREQQHEIILAVIAALGFDPQQIPDGGKSKTKTICLTRPRLFTPEGFDHAWKAGVSAGLFKLANHEKYSSK